MDRHRVPTSNILAMPSALVCSIWATVEYLHHLDWYSVLSGCLSFRHAVAPIATLSGGRMPALGLPLLLPLLRHHRNVGLTLYRALIAMCAIAVAELAEHATAISAAHTWQRRQA